MYSSGMRSVVLIAAVTCLVVGAAAVESAGAPPAWAYFPLAVGDTWYYTSYSISYGDLTGGGLPPAVPFARTRAAVTVRSGGYHISRRTWEISGTEEIGGVDTYIWNRGSGDPLFYLAAQSGGIFCYKLGDEPMTPPQRLLKFPFTVGSSWTFGYPPTWSHQFTVQSINDTVEVSAGTFTNCVRLKLVQAGSMGPTTRFAPLADTRHSLIWLAPFVGVVRVQDYESGNLIEWMDLEDFDVYIEDSTPPTTPVVIDDGAISYGNSIHAKWSSEDPESGIAGYWAAVSTTPDVTGILPDAEYQDIGVVNEGTSPGIPSLVDGGTYYLLLKARNNGGLESEIGVTDGIQVRLTPPTEDLLPLVVGNYWSYALWSAYGPERCSGAEAEGRIYVKSSKVVSGSTRYDVVVKIGQPVPEINTMGRTAAGWVIYAKDGKPISPPALFVKDNPILGETWTSVDEPGGGLVRHQVISLDDVVNVPAGEFVCVAILETYDDWPSESQVFWWAPGIGLVQLERYEDQSLVGSVQLSGWHVFAGPPDTTPPTKPTVGLASATFFGTEVRANWSSSDAQSGICEYQVAFSTTASEAGKIGKWQSFGKNTAATLDGSGLTTGVRYYVIVKARNCADLWSVVGASSAFTVQKPIDYIDIDPPDVELPVKARKQFKARVFDTDGTEIKGKRIIWNADECEGEGIGSISKGGMFTAGCTPGVCTVTAKIEGSEVEGTAVVTVVPGRPFKISVDPANKEVECAETVEYAATVVDSCGNEVRCEGLVWSVRNPKAGEIDGTTGEFTAGFCPGSYRGAIMAKCGAVTGQTGVTIRPTIPSRVEISPTEASVRVGKVQRFTAVGYDALDRAICNLRFQWKVDPPELGTINSVGKFTAGRQVGSGFVRAQALVNGVPAGPVAEAPVELTPGPPYKVLVQPQDVRMGFEGSQQFEATVTDLYGNPLEVGLIWSVSSPTAGVIDQDGMFTAGTTAGTFYVRAKTDPGGKVGQAKVKIMAAL